MKYFFILLFSIGLSKLSLAQEGTLQKFDLKITYELSYLGDSTDLNTKRSESTLLFIQGDNSLFETANSHLRDSLDFISVTEGERKLYLPPSIGQKFCFLSLFFCAYCR